MHCNSDKVKGRLGAATTWSNVDNKIITLRATCRST